MQLHEGIRRHTQVVEALSFVAQIELDPLSSDYHEEGEFRVGNWSRIGTAALYLASMTTAAAKLKMGGPLLELSLLLESSVLLIYKNKWVKYKRYQIIGH